MPSDSETNLKTHFPTFITYFGCLICFTADTLKHICPSTDLQEYASFPCSTAHFCKKSQYNVIEWISSILNDPSMTIFQQESLHTCANIFTSHNMSTSRHEIQPQSKLSVLFANCKTLLPASKILAPEKINQMSEL